MILRILTGVIGIIVLVACVLRGILPTGIFFSLLAILGIREAVRLGGKIRDFSMLAAVSTLFVVATAAVAEWKLMGRLVVVPAIVAIYVLRGISRPAILPVIYPALAAVGFASAIALRTTSGPSLLMTILVSTWATDTGAYFIGCRWGKTPFAPMISPRKTWEGAVGGLIASLLAGLLSGWIIDRLLFGIAAGIICGTLGQLGDLAESRLKRLADEKDSGHLLPGHGGVLDRFDSFLVNVSFCLLFA